MLPPELHDEDGMPIAVREDLLTRGQARAYFTRGRGIPFTEGSMTLAWFRRDPANPHAVLLWMCERGALGAQPYWYFHEWRP